jgi:hypothetical protein
MQGCEPSIEPCKEGMDCLKTSGLLRNGWTPLLDRPDTCQRQVTHQSESERCTRACLILILGCEPSAEHGKEGVDCMKSNGLPQNGWTPLPDRPGTSPRQVTCQNESEHCTRSSSIPIQDCKPSTEPCKEGVDCFEMDGLLCQIGQALAQGQLRVKMSQSSVPDHVQSQYRAASQH